jgi:8-oxo-dGTP diphosphatase
MNPTVIAAGTVVWRKNKKRIEIAVVHRPRYDDWSIPKGKVEGSESLIACAYREGQEETGLDFRFGPFVGQIEYLTEEGLKQVSYWAAELVENGKEFSPNSEVDQLLWLDIDSAIEKLSRESDKEILERFNDVPYQSTPLVLLRHAKALAREEWQGEDEDRPLEVRGQNQARRMLMNYLPFGIKEIHTSDAVRCYDTVTAMGRALGIEPLVAKDVSEYTFKKNKDKAIDYIKELSLYVSATNTPTIVCSHNPVLPKMLGKLLKKSKVAEKQLPAGKLQPGDAWIVFLSKKKVVQVDFLVAP